MTAEVVLMNKEAVALAADSAVTIGGSKIFNSANKLFMLAPGHPVGVMVYNNAHFMDLPWEIVIKHYRERLVTSGKRFETLEQYGDDFIAFLTETNGGLIPEDQQRVVFQITIDTIMNEIVRRIWERIKDRVYNRAERMSEDEVIEIVNQAIDFYHQDWKQYPDLYAGAEQKRFVEELIQKYKRDIDASRKLLFDKLPLSSPEKKKIEEICVFLFTKDRLLWYFSGLVLAGFGNSSQFPSCLHYTVENVIGNKLKYKLQDQAKIDFHGMTGVIMPFAQHDVIISLITGIHPIYSVQLDQGLSQLIGEQLPDKVLKLLENIPEGEQAALKEAILAALVHEMQGVLRQTNQRIREQYTDPIMQIVAVLPKDELARMAETLVSLTSFMRRVSMVMETVGGPIDVAIISKKDGFVWTKRKHYFDIKDNLHFSTHYEP